LDSRAVQEAVLLLHNNLSILIIGFRQGWKEEESAEVLSLSILIIGFL